MRPPVMGDVTGNSVGMENGSGQLLAQPTSRFPATGICIFAALPASFSSAVHEGERTFFPTCHRSFLH